MIKKKKILVIDDDRQTRELIAKVLTTNEFEVLLAPGGREGIQVAKMKHPNVILLDMNMPHFNGIQTCKAMKRLGEIKNIPVIFLTADQKQEDILEAIKAGGRDYIIKPFSPEEVIKRLQALTAESDEQFEASSIVKSGELPSGQLNLDHNSNDSKSKSSFTFQTKKNVLVITVNLESCDSDNYITYLDMFKYILKKDYVKIVIDIKKLDLIDNTGLALFISFKNMFENEDRKVYIANPSSELNNCFSFINISYLFPAYDSLNEAVENILKMDQDDKTTLEIIELLICASCTYANPKDFHHCEKCGADLLLGKDDNIIQTLRKNISRKVFLDAQTDNVHKLNTTRNIEPEHVITPEEFDVEVKFKKLFLSYRSKLINDSELLESNKISIQFPKIKDTAIHLTEGLPIILKNNQIGSRSAYDTNIIASNTDTKEMIVKYTPEARIMHSEKSFSVSVRPPIEIKLFDPDFDNKEYKYSGSIIEISRLALKVSSFNEIPVNRCLTAKFELADDIVITTPFVIAKHGDSDFTYDVEFIVIDEKERSNIIKYMYQCQIEGKKGQEKK